MLPPGHPRGLRPEEMVYHGPYLLHSLLQSSHVAGEGDEGHRRAICRQGRGARAAVERRCTDELVMHQQGRAAGAGAQGRGGGYTAGSPRPGPWY